MCGISGYIGKRSLDKLTIQSTLNLMKNRGPDNSGYTRFNTNKNEVFLLSSRLKIVDRKQRSNQPMKIGAYTIVYNGEIYNLKKIKKILNNKISLKTNSDTELILSLYICYGPSFVNLLDGMWAFAIYDQSKKILMLSRDRIGEKPLFYKKNIEGFYFGSETKYIRNLLNNYNEINEIKLCQYLKYGYKSIESNNESFFKGVFKVEPGQNLVINDNLDLKFNKYWEIKPIENNHPESEIIKKVKYNFRKHLPDICNTDLKIGLCLSGGIDSNYLLGFLTKYINTNISTYSIIDDNKDKRYNEENLIDSSVKYHNVKNKKIYLSKEKNYFEKLKTLIKYHDKPVSTISYFLQSLLYKKMKEDNVKVSITGNGADEMFSGYYHHYSLYYSCLNSSKKKNYLKQWKKNILPFIRNKEFRNLEKTNIQSNFNFFKDNFFKVDNINKFKERFFLKNKLKNKLLNEMFYQTLPLALLEDDLNAMFYSIENRSPFLNKELLQYAYGIPTNLLMKDTYNKYILRKCLKSLAPEIIRTNREKKGFNASFNSIFSFKDKKFSEWFFDEGSSIFNIVNRKEYIKLFKNKYEEGFPDMNQQCLFNITSAKMFLESIE